MGKKTHLWTQIKSVIFLNKEGMFYFKNDSFYLEKGALFGCGNFWGASAPGPLIPPPMTVPLQGQWERFTGTISRFRRHYKSPIVKG